MASQDRESRTIVLNIPVEDYLQFITHNEFARKSIENQYKCFPELFPECFHKGFKLNGYERVSKKTGQRMRRISSNGITYRIRPSFLMPYNREVTPEVEKALFLIKFGVPFWALGSVFGKNHMYWYRLFISLSSFSLVGTSIHKKETLPENLLSDEFHSRQQGSKVYVATTVAQECILGVEACCQVTANALEKAYGVFKKEARDLDATYSPKTVNTDGWNATQIAWKKIFPCVAIIECFLHAFLKIRDRATKALQPSFLQVAEKVWNIYRSDNKRSMSQMIRRLKEWTQENVPDSPMKENVLKLVSKRKNWLRHLDFEGIYRTSSQLDRVMRLMERHAVNSQKFHSTVEATTLNFRALALLHNFTPYSPWTRIKNGGYTSPVHKINGY
ncbi:hypothetical protein, partial [Algivirga pacifica]|uniref:hypothetical protein n=1 Tax=Algivirga pacifica TaxID=1162670 RepID=UPI0031EEFABE